MRLSEITFQNDSSDVDDVKEETCHKHFQKLAQQITLQLFTKEKYLHDKHQLKIVER